MACSRTYGLSLVELLDDGWHTRSVWHAPETLPVLAQDTRPVLSHEHHTSLGTSIETTSPGDFLGPEGQEDEEVDEYPPRRLPNGFGRQHSDSLLLVAARAEALRAACLNEPPHPDHPLPVLPMLTAQLAASVLPSPAKGPPPTTRIQDAARPLQALAQAPVTTGAAQPSVLALRDACPASHSSDTAVTPRACSAARAVRHSLYSNKSKPTSMIFGMSMSAMDVFHMEVEASREDMEVPETGSMCGRASHDAGVARALQAGAAAYEQDEITPAQAGSEGNMSVSELMVMLRQRAVSIKPGPTVHGVPAAVQARPAVGATAPGVAAPVTAGRVPTPESLGAVAGAAGTTLVAPPALRRIQTSPQRPNAARAETVAETAAEFARETGAPVLGISQDVGSFKADPVTNAAPAASTDVTLKPGMDQPTLPNGQDADNHRSMACHDSSACHLQQCHGQQEQQAVQETGPAAAPAKADGCKADEKLPMLYGACSVPLGGEGATEEGDPHAAALGLNCSPPMQLTACVSLSHPSLLNDSSHVNHAGAGTHKYTFLDSGDFDCGGEGSGSLGSAAIGNGRLKLGSLGAVGYGVVEVGGCGVSYGDRVVADGGQWTPELSFAEMASEGVGKEAAAKAMGAEHGGVTVVKRHPGSHVRYEVVPYPLYEPPLADMQDIRVCQPVRVVGFTIRPESA